MTQWLPLPPIYHVFGSSSSTWGARCNHTPRACTRKNLPNSGKGLSLTSPSITVEHCHVNVRGAGVSQQAVIQG